VRRLTASKFGLAQRCAYFLREEVAHDDSPMGPAAQEGTELHAMIQADLEGKPIPQTTSPAVAAKYVAWTAWAPSERRIGWQPEVAYAYDPKADAARVLDQAHHRDYSGARAGEVAMQLDVVTFGEDVEGTYAEVLDWKSGQRSDGATAQVEIAALALSRAHGVDRVRTRVVYVGEDGVSVDEAWLSSFDLDMVRGRLLRILAVADPEPVPGGHCSALFCPARHACPATVQALAEVSRLPQPEIAQLVAEAITTPAAAGAAHVRLRVIKDAVKAIEERVRAVVEEHGYAPTPTGKVLRLVTTTRETFSRSRLPKQDAEGIMRELRELGALAESTSSYVKECSK
jgi:hypothetical protein